MDIRSKKLEIIRWLADINDEELIKRIHSLKESFTELTPNEKKAVDEGLKSIKSGRTKTHHEALSLTKKNTRSFSMSN